MTLLYLKHNISLDFLSLTSHSHLLNTIFLFYRALMDPVTIILVAFQLKFRIGSAFRMTSPT